DLVYSFIKSLLFGGAIAVVACYHGLHPGSRSIHAVPRAAIRAVTEGLLLVMLLNVVFAYVVYGTAFFGLITAEQLAPCCAASRSPTRKAPSASGWRRPAPTASPPAAGRSC